MRTELAKQYNVRSRFSGTFLHFGTKRGYKHTLTTVLLVDIVDDQHKSMTDHLWFNFTKEFEELYLHERLKSGTILSFNARVDSYVKGYHKDEIDYHLSYPRKFKIEGMNPKYMNETHEPPYEFHRRNVLTIAQNKQSGELITINDLIANRNEQTMVVDIHKRNGVRPQFDVYIGRMVKHTEFTEDSKWCNKDRMGLVEYKAYIKQKIRENPEYYNLDELRNKIMGCWCITTTEIFPMKCHGQVLMQLLHEQDTKQVQTIESMVENVKEREKYIPKKASEVTPLVIHDLTRFITKKKE